MTARIQGMTVRRRVLVGFVLAALLGCGVWYGWQRWTTPALPAISLDGVAKERVEKIEEAAAKLRRAPRAGAAWGEFGMVLAANGLFVEAIPCFVHAQRFDPSQPRWPYFHAYALAHCARPREALAKMRQALALSRGAGERGPILLPLALALIEDGQLVAAEQSLSELRELEGDSPALDFGLGMLALAREDRTAARERLAKVAGHPSARQRACSLLAGLVQGNETLAEHYRQQALALPGDQPWPDSFDGLLKEHGARFEEIKTFTALRKAVVESPNEMVCYGLGHNLFLTGQWDEAATALRQTIAFNPRNTKAHFYLGACLYEMAEKLFQTPDGKEQAAELFRDALLAEEKALSLQKELPHAHLIRGKALRRLGRTEESLQALREAVLVGADSAEMHLALGEGLAEAGLLREAWTHLENAVSLAQPDNPGPREALEKWRAKAKKP